MNRVQAQKNALQWSGIEVNSKTQYLILPGTDSIQHPQFLFQNSISSTLTFKGANFSVGYSYTNPLSLIGNRNGFTFRFVPPAKFVDPKAAQAELTRKLKSSIDSLDQLSSNYQKRIQYLEQLKVDSISVPKWNLIDTSKFQIPDAPKLPGQVDSLERFDLNNNKLDSTTSKYISLFDELKRSKSELERIQKIKSEYSSKLNALSDMKENFFSNPFSKSLPFRMRKLSVGNFTASNSPITLWGTSLIGASSAFTKGNYYVEGGLGKLQAPMFPDMNQLGFSKQILNAFSTWSQSLSSSSRTLSWIVVGVGTPEQSHLFLQGLTGRGKRTLADDQSSNAVNYVLEGQSQWVKGSTKFELNGSKSFLSRPASLIGDAKYEHARYDVGYALHSGLNHFFEKSNSDLSAKFNLFTSNYSSFGVSIPRHDYLQSQIQWKQRIGKRLNLSLQMKYDQAGLKSKVYDFRSVNSSLRFRLFKRGTLQLNGSENKGIIQVDTATVQINQAIYSGIFNLPIKLGKIIPIFSCQQISSFNKTQNSINIIENTSAFVSLSKNAVSARLSYSRMVQESGDSLRTEMNYAEVVIGVTKSKWNASVSYKQNLSATSIKGIMLQGGFTLGDFTLQGTIEKYVYDPLAMPWLSAELASQYPYRGSIQFSYIIKNRKS